MRKLLSRFRPGARLWLKQPAFALIAFVALGLSLAANIVGGGSAPAVAANQPPRPNAPAAAGDFELQQLADGVYAAIRKQPPLFSFDPNNVFIINDDDVVVVDANASLAATKELVAALRRLTGKPVKYVINTHYDAEGPAGRDQGRPPRGAVGEHRAAR